MQQARTFLCTNLERAKFIGANLSGAFFDGADIGGADFTDCTLETGQLDYTIRDQETRYPDGYSGQTAPQTLQDLKKLSKLPERDGFSELRPVKRSS